MGRVSRRGFLSTAGAGAAAAGPGRATGKSAAVRVVEDVPVVDEADICVLGGSSTGVFAAVRAARLGARVALVEKQSHFGGVAAVTCTWHSLHDARHERRIIAGLTGEIVGRMRKRGGVAEIRNNASKGFEFSPGELKLALDEMVLEAGVRPHLHTLFSAPVVEGGRLSAVVVDGKSGRGAIRARYFIDATGDGDLCSRLGLAEYSYPAPLPPTTCAFLANWQSLKGVNLGAEIREHGREFNLDEGFVWGSVIPGTDVYMLAGTRVNKVNCAVARDLTAAEIEGRRQVKAILDLLRRYHPERKVALHDFPATIGIRDTRHIRCGYQLKGEDVLGGRRFEDGIANGSYRVDIHHQEKPGITLKYLDGTQTYNRPGYPPESGRWRPETPDNPTFYQVPLRSLIPGGHANLILAGRMLDADITAFSAVRVMVNTNQMGEAAGVAAYLALDGDAGIGAVKPGRVRDTMARGGSLIL
jgi:hypothetical protein